MTCRRWVVGGFGSHTHSNPCDAHNLTEGLDFDTDIKLL